MQIDSQREKLFERVNMSRLANRLSHNLEQLSRTQERLSASRYSSASSSRSSIRRSYSTADLQKSQSKASLLKNIADKLKQSRSSLHEHTPKAKEISDDKLQLSNEPKGRSNKLEQMLKDIKKCNQMSTKAVYSIKRNINDGLKEGQPNFNQPNYQQKQQQTVSRFQTDPKPTNMQAIFGELGELKSQMQKLKAENRQLVQIIKQSGSRLVREGEICNACGCNCKKRTSSPRKNGL